MASLVKAPSIKTLRAITDEYTPGKEIGKGSYGTVHICSHITSPDDLSLVIKKIDLHKMKRKDLGDMIKEAKLLQMFNHPNIVKAVDYFSTPDTLCIIQDFCNAHDLGVLLFSVLHVTSKLFDARVPAY
jgi:serine/threonine protein kinase